MRPLLVGEDNPYGRDQRYALYPSPDYSAGGRLCFQIMGLSLKEYIGRFDRVNLCSEKWTIREARDKAVEVLKERLDQERIDGPMAIFVLLGTKVCNAFGIPFNPFTIQSYGRFVILPHPSGRNRLWNNPTSFETARAVLRQSGVLP